MHFCWLAGRVSEKYFHSLFNDFISYFTLALLELKSEKIQIFPSFPFYIRLHFHVVVIHTEVARIKLRGIFLLSSFVSNSTIMKIWWVAFTYIQLLKEKLAHVP